MKVGLMLVIHSSCQALLDDDTQSRPVEVIAGLGRAGLRWLRIGPSRARLDVVARTGRRLLDLVAPARRAEDRDEGARRR